MSITTEYFQMLILKNNKILKKSEFLLYFPYSIVFQILPYLILMYIHFYKTL